MGSHLVTPRLGYTHHGIYVGGDRVVQYGALAHQLNRQPVEEVSLARFAHGRPVRVRFHESLLFDASEVIQRARSRIGEDSYSLLRNNCEHLCEWCLYGVSRSYQVERALALPRVLARIASTLVAALSGSFARALYC